MLHTILSHRMYTLGVLIVCCLVYVCIKKTKLTVISALFFIFIMTFKYMNGIYIMFFL